MKNRFAAHILRYRQANALMRTRGWRANYLGSWDGGYEGTATKDLGGGAWRASFYHSLDWLLSFSPYHAVHPGVAYPAVLFTAFDGGPRVDPSHARKLCAALQHATAGDAPILLRTERDVGHSLRAMSRAVELLADTLCFFADQLGQSDLRFRSDLVDVGTPLVS